MAERACPGPEHTSRDPWPAGMPVPSPAAKLARGARAAGWTVLETYALGWALPVKLAEPAYRVATVAVRFSRTLSAYRVRAGYVVYHCRLNRSPAKWEAKGACVWGSDHDPVVAGLGVTEVGRYLVEGAEWTSTQVHAWRDALKIKLLEAARRNAEAAKNRPAKAKVI